ncbi:hypothetical protein [Brachybacterium sp. Marseille-Q7125]|uniref:hypothetical protein n=1 Tax=Brachybacterium sp. Marseille-Q7125 TaxID=2932815 RepID=UPI001FF18B31|nr:hypothetical protein [Brachybacterium sp. Marseille-Q7125]
MITDPVSLLADPDLVPLVQAIRAEILTGSASPEGIALSLLEQPQAYPDPPRWTQQIEAVDEDDIGAVITPFQVIEDLVLDPPTGNPGRRHPSARPGGLSDSRRP